MIKDYGLFPFGQPNTERPMRAPTDGIAQVTVVGVYPSAWHVRWTAPSHLRDRVPNGGVAAMAVDVEPEVFWNGDGTGFDTQLARWRDEVNFVEGDRRGAHGHVAWKSPSTNGSSGRKVEGRYLAALGVDATRTAFTDVCPVFFAKYGNSARRPQGTAIEQEYNAVAGDLGVKPASLPARPTVKALVRKAVEEYGASLLADLERADAPLVVTLGEEVLQTLRQLPQLEAVPPAESLTEIYDCGLYGKEGTLRVNGRRIRWLPLPHPGLLTGETPPASIPTASATQAFTTGPVTLARGGRRDWNAAHAQWEHRTRSDR